jgi:nicotinamide-nucleotide amidase
LLVQILDTIALFLSRKLAEIGFDLHFKTTVGDNTGRLTAALEIAAGRADVIIVTGGLGPTVDDITRDAISAFTGRKMVMDNQLFSRIAGYFKKRNIEMPENNQLQAYMPEGATMLENRAGIAPGFIIEHNSKIIAVMPGVPSEMHPMMEKSVMPYLLEKFGPAAGVIKSKVLHVVNLPESVIDEKIEDLFRSLANPTIALLAHQAEVDVRITAKAAGVTDADEMISKVKAQIYERLGDNIFYEDDETLEQKVAQLLFDKKITVATAESCTAGLVAFRLTSVAGSSGFFMGGVNAYANSAKINIIGVDEEIIKIHGAVSAECAADMASKTREKFGADSAISVTGIAGPGGGSEEKPVGLVYIGVDINGEVKTHKYIFPGSRESIRVRAAQTALLCYYKESKNA